MARYSLSAQLDAAAAISADGRVPNLGAAAGASGSISGAIAVRQRVATTVTAAGGISGDLRLNKYRIGGALAGAGAISSSPYPWYGAANAVPVRSQFAAIPDAVGSHAFAITPSDTTVFSPTRWLWVGGTGDLAVIMNDGSQFVFSAVAAGTRLPISITQVLGTNTTATAIVGVT